MQTENRLLDDLARVAGGALGTLQGVKSEVTARLRALDGVLDVSRQQQDGNTFRYTLECRPGANLREQLSATIVRQGWGLLGLQAVSMSLEDIFLRLTAREEGESPR